MQYASLDELTGELTGLMLLTRDISEDSRILNCSLTPIHDDDLPVYDSSVVRKALSYYFDSLTCDELYADLVSSVGGSEPAHFLHVDVFGFLLEQATAISDSRAAELRALERELDLEFDESTTEIED